MSVYDAIGSYCTLRHLALFTGLCDRTLRNYIASGLLQGEKISGLWHFTDEQVASFMSHPAVRPSIQAKRMSLIADFLADDTKNEAQCCMILDLPDIDRTRAIDFFCDEIQQRELENFHFSFDGFSKTPRVILRGKTDDVLALVNAFKLV